MVPVPHMEEWRYASMVNGELSVMTIGTQEMLEWSAANLGTLDMASRRNYEDFAARITL